MKKLFSFLFTAILVITMMPQAIGASADSGEPRIYWQDTTVNYGDSFSIFIYAENLEPGKSIMITVNFDDSVLQLTNGEWFLTDADICDWNCTTKDGVAAYLEYHSFNGRLLRLDFEAVNVPESTSSVVDFDIVCIFNREGNYVPVEPGTINVLHTHEPGTWHFEDEQYHVATCGLCKQIMQQEHDFVEDGYDADKRANILTCHTCRTQKFFVRHGDIDRNGQIESSDARSILRFAVELDIPDETQRILADVNADGRISSEDARLTLRTSVELEDKAGLPVMQVSPV